MNSHFDKMTIDENSIPIISGLADNLPGGFFIYHADGNEDLIYFNKQIPAMYGCKSDDEFIRFVGNSFRGMVHPEDLERVEAEIAFQIGKGEGAPDEELFHFHENPNQECPVGRNIHHVLDDKLTRIQKAMEDELSKITLDDVKKDVTLWIAKEQ